jgi:hypothetical protein
MKEIEIIEYNEEYRDSTINLLKKAFHGLSEATFSWLFESSDEDRPIIVCAVDSGNVISFNSWIRWLFVWEGKTFVGYQSGESATDNDYRRMGIWRKVIDLGEQIAKERGYIDFFFGFPDDISLGGFVKAGYSHVGTYDKNIRIINPFLWRPQSKANQEISPAPGARYLLQNNKLTPVVDSNYIEWRYHRNPKDYRIINYFESNNISTFLLRQSTYYNKRYGVGFPEVQILDCRFTSYDDTFVHNSFKYIDSLFSRKAVWLGTFFNEGTDKGKAIKYHFHINFKHRGGKLIFKKINPAIDNELFSGFDNWDLQPHVVDSN